MASVTVEMPAQPSGPTPPPKYILSDGESGPRRNKVIIPWATIAAITATLSVSGGALIGLGRLLFASKDEHIELRAIVNAHNDKIDAAYARLQASTDRLTLTIEKLNEQVIRLYARERDRDDDRRLQR